MPRDLAGSGWWSRLHARCVHRPARRTFCRSSSAPHGPGASSCYPWRAWIFSYQKTTPSDAVGVKAPGVAVARPESVPGRQAASSSARQPGWKYLVQVGAHADIRILRPPVPGSGSGPYQSARGRYASTIDPGAPAAGASARYHRWSRYPAPRPRSASDMESIQRSTNPLFIFADGINYDFHPRSSFPSDFDTDAKQADSSAPACPVLVCGTGRDWGQSSFWMVRAASVRVALSSVALRVMVPRRR